MSSYRSTTLSLLLLLLCVPLYGQSGRTDPRTEGKKNQREERPLPTPPAPAPGRPVIDSDEIIKVNTMLVSVPVRVMDRTGRFIGGLSRGNFRVFENGKEQEIALFSNENEPFTVALMLDMSYSAKFKISEIQSAAIAFIDQLRPQDQVMVVSFDGEVHIHCEPTSDRREIYRAIRSTKIGTGTSLYEAIDNVMNRQLRNVEGRKAIILFSDGVDTTSRRANDMTNLHDALELDSLIYTIKYDTFADVQSMKGGTVLPGPRIQVPTNPTSSPFPTGFPPIGLPGSQGTTVEEYRKAAEYLEQLALRTGGRIYEATSLVNLADAYARIASELREFYTIAYYPEEDRAPGRSNSVKVKVDKEGLVVRSRETFNDRRMTRKDK